MNNEPTTCPKCGANEMLPRHTCGCIFWECGSRREYRKEFVESKECLQRQLDESLHLLKRAKRNLLAEGDFESDCFEDVSEFVEKYK